VKKGERESFCDYVRGNGIISGGSARTTCPQEGYRGGVTVFVPKGINIIATRVRGASGEGLQNGLPTRKKDVRKFLRFG